MFKSIIWLLKWFVLVTLPLTLTPALHGAITGILFGPWNARQVNENIDRYLNEKRDVLDDWGVGGGAPSFRQFQDTNNDFHLMKINSDDWLEKLGFMLPMEYSPLADPEPTIDKFADVETLMRDTRGSQGKKEQWLYLTNWAWPSYDADDAAFNEVVQRAYVHPRLNQTGLFFAECSGSAGFLCGIWAAKHPALLHFLVEDDPVDEADIEGFTYAAPIQHLRHVTTRLIEFPLKEEYTGLALPTFASAEEQMLAMMTGDRLYEQFDQFSPDYQTLDKFLDYMDDIWDTEGTLLHYLDVSDSWLSDNIREPIGIQLLAAIIWNVMFGITGFASNLAMSLFAAANHIIGGFLGRPRRGDVIMAGVDEDATPEDNFWGPILGGFGDYVEKRMAEEDISSRQAEAENPITTA